MMSISFLLPAALWLLLLLIPLWALTLATRRYRAAAGRWASLLIRTVLLAALVLAIAGARIMRPTSDLTTVFLLDRSGSIAPEARARADAFIQSALAAMQPGDQAGVVAFGANALVDQPIENQQSFTDLQSTPVITGTNIQDAVQLGLAMLPAETNKRLVLLSDGGQNAGDARVAEQLASAQGIPISYIDLGLPASAGEAQISELHAPASTRIGQSVTLDVAVESTIAQSAHLKIWNGDQVISEQDVALQPGQNHFSATATTETAGMQRFRAEVTPQQDAQPANNTAEALVRVDGPPRVLLVEGQPGAAQNLKDALSAAQATVEVAAPSGLPTDIGQLSAYDAVALINVPASTLAPQTMTNLNTFVHDLGKGLVMIGGDQSYGLGGYSHTPIEQALPVEMQLPNKQERPNLALIFVLDKSSSMQACHCRGPSREKDGFYDHNGRTRLEIGKDAVVRSVDVLNKQDVVGVVAFDGQVQWAFQPQANFTTDQVQSAIAPLQPNGHETNIGIGLRAAQAAMNKIDASIKHVVLYTDGWAVGEDPVAITKEMRAQGMTISTITEGPGSAPMLKQVAEDGGGRYFAVANMEQALQVLVDETRQVSGNFMVEQAFTPAYAAATPILAGLDQGLPQLYGYNGTTPKQTATVALKGTDDAPILTQWQYGLGRSVAWASDAQGHWARDWVSWPEFPRFASQLIGWVLPTVSASGLSVDMTNTGNQSQISVNAQDAAGQPRIGLDMRAIVVAPDGTQQTVPLTASAPGVYNGSIASPGPGSYQVQIAGSQNGQPVAQESAALVVPYSAEYRLGQSNPALLAELAQRTGGTQLADPAEAFARADQHAEHAQEITLPLLLLALILLPLDIAVRRLLVYRRLRQGSGVRG